jgi:hypothetical protein
MSRYDLHADMMNAMTNVVLKRVENCVKGLQADPSATSNEHVVGYSSGFQAAKRAMLDMLTDFSELRTKESG